MKASHRYAQAIGLALLLFGPFTLSAQQRQDRWPQDSSRVISLRHPAVRYGKWLTLAGAAAGATYGVLTNQKSDNEYNRLERTCRDEPARCARLADGSYSDAELESTYQDVLRWDDRARLVLIAAQVSLVTSVALFIIDLPRGGSGEDIPYSPPRFQVGYDQHSRLNFSYRVVR